MNIKSYRDLRVWRLAVDLAVDCYAASSTFPKTETYGLRAQLRRASVSVSANIAEGHGRAHRGDYRRHLSIARGSIKELETHLIIAFRLGYVEKARVKALLRTADHVSRMITTIRKRLEPREE